VGDTGSFRGMTVYLLMGCPICAMAASLVIDTNVPPVPEVRVGYFDGKIFQLAPAMATAEQPPGQPLTAVRPVPLQSRRFHGDGGWLRAGAQLARCLRPVGRSIAMASWCGSPVGKHGRTPADGQGPCEVGGKDGGKQVWMTRRRVLEQPFP
jgi:hypothetical protein